MVKRLLTYRQGLHWGYMNTHGNVECPPRFTVACNFSEGLAIAACESVYHVINTDFETTGRFRDGLYVVDAFSDRMVIATDEETFLSYYCDTHGAIAIRKGFAVATPFIRGRAVVEYDGLYGIVERSGRWVTTPRWKSARPFSVHSDFTSVQDMQSSMWYIVDRNGDRVSRSVFDELLSVCGEYVPFGERNNRCNKYGIAHVSGVRVMQPRFCACDDSLANGTLGVEDECLKWGVIDLHERWIIKPQYSYIGQRSSGFYLAYAGGGRDVGGNLVDGKFGFVRDDGACVTDFVFDNAFAMNDGIALVSWIRPSDSTGLSSFLGYFRSDGVIIWKESECRY